MKVVPATSETIEEAARLIRAGHLVAFPTETVYGLGADACNESAVRRIFEAKGRPSNNPLIVHIPDLDRVSLVADVKSDEVVARRFNSLSDLWPGPISIVVPRTQSVAPSVSGGTSSPTVAIRIPNHPVALALLKVSGCPIAAPSANPSGYISPTTAEHVAQSLSGQVSMVLDGGPCNVGLESTVISIVGDQPVLLRPGAVGREELEARLGEHVCDFAPASSQTPILPSPGLLEKHYAPKTKTMFMRNFDGSSNQSKIGILWFSKTEPRVPYERLIRVTLSGNPEEIAPKLYSALRELDNSGLDLILLDECAPNGIGVAVLDRLTRATKN